MEDNKLYYRSIISNSDTESRTICGMALVFNSWSEDLGGFREIILPTAVTNELIQRCDIIANYNHDSDNYMMARSKNGNGTLKLELRNEGLYFEFDAPTTPKGDELLYHIRNGNLSECSFAFTLPMDNKECQRWYKEDGELKREIKLIDGLYDVSIVPNGAYSSTYCYSRNLELAKQVLEELEERSEEKEEDEKTPLEEPKNDEVDNVSDDEKEENTDTKEEEIEGEKEEENKDKEEQRNINNNINNSRIKMNKEFRLIKAIRDVANNRSLDEVTNAVVAEGAEELRKSGLSYGGQIQLPTLESRATITIASEGDDLIATDLYDIVEPLRAKNVVVNAGAKFITGLVGDVQIPIMEGGNVTWEGEVASAKDGAGSFTNIKLSPRRLTAYVDLSKAFLNQDGLGAEQMIRQDIINAVNAKLEASILSSFSGSTTQPKGLLAYSGVTSAGTVSAYSGLTDLEATVEEKNIYGDMAYILSPKAKGALRAMAKSTKNTQLVMEGGEVDGTKAYSTSHLSGKDFVYGDFSNLVIGSWGAIDLTVDPYTKAADGQVRLVVNAYFDFKPVRDIAFGKGTIA